MAPSISSRHHGQRFNLHIELAKKMLDHTNSRAGNHDHLGINKQADRIQSYQSRTPTPQPAPA